VEKIKKIAEYIKSRFQRVYDSFDIRDFFVYIGLGLLFYGLYLLQPWIAFSVCGVLLMAIGYLMPPRAK